APAPSRKERAPPESRENGSTATPSTVSPTPSMLSHTPAAGRSRRASPHRPSSATARVVRMNTGSLTRAAPATRSEERKGTQLVVPRRFSSKFIQRVVSEHDSTSSVKGGEYLPRISSGPTHQKQTASPAGTHQRLK